MIESAAALFIGLLAGFVIGWRARARYGVPQAASGKLTVQYRSPLHVEPSEFSHGWEGH